MTFILHCALEWTFCEKTATIVFTMKMLELILLYICIIHWKTYPKYVKKWYPVMIMHWRVRKFSSYFFCLKAHQIVECLPMNCKKNIVKPIGKKILEEFTLNVAVVIVFIEWLLSDSILLLGLFKLISGVFPKLYVWWKKSSSCNSDLNAGWLRLIWLIANGYQNVESLTLVKRGATLLPMV